MDSAQWSCYTGQCVTVRSVGHAPLRSALCADRRSPYCTPAAACGVRAEEQTVTETKAAADLLVLLVLQFSEYGFTRRSRRQCASSSLPIEYDTYCITTTTILQVQYSCISTVGCTDSRDCNPISGRRTELGTRKPRTPQPAPPTPPHVHLGDCTTHEHGHGHAMDMDTSRACDGHGDVILGVQALHSTALYHGTAYT